MTVAFSEADASAGGTTPGWLFQVIKSQPGMSQAQLSEVTRLTRGHLKTLTDPLVAAGLVAEREGPSTGGRRPRQLAFNAEAGLVLTADFGRSHADLAVTDLDANVLARTTGDRRLDEGPETILKWVSGEFEQLVAGLGRPLRDVYGIGVGLPGPVEFASGRAIEPPLMPGWHAVSVQDQLGKRFGVPVITDNDANSEALGEYWAHQRGRTNDLLYVKAGTGIGCGIISEGRLLRGALGGAGEIGHVVVDDSDTVRCRCGNYGCLEALAGGAALVERLRKQGHELTDARDVTSMVLAGVPDAVGAIRDAGRLVGTALASAVTLLNPDLVIVGGVLGECGEHLLVGIREVIYRRSMVLHLNRLRIEPARLADQAGVVGAAVNVLEDILSPSAIDALTAA